MNAKVEQYLAAVCSRVKCAEVHDEIRQELLSHLEDLLEHHRGAGLSEEKAMDAALAQMGDPEATGDQLNDAHKPRTDWGLIGATTIFVLLGLWAIYAVQVSDTFGAVTVGRQMLWSALGLGAGAAAFFFNYRRLQRFAWAAFGVTVVAMPVVQFYSDVINRQDPLLERSPMLLTLALAGIFTAWDWSDRRSVWKAMGLLIAPTLVYMWAPSKAALIQYWVGFGVLLLASKPKRWQLGTFAGIAMALVGAALLQVIRHPWAAERLLVALNPTRDPMGAGYQVVQSRLAIQGGGLWGQGATATLDRLPETYAEFVFPYLVYTLGWVAGAAIILLVILFMVRLLKIAGQIRDQFGRLVVVAVVASFAVQFGYNLLMTVGLLPVTGISLPFIAYGAQQVVQMTAVGLALSVFRRKDMGRTPHLG